MNNHILRILVGLSLGLLVGLSLAGVVTRTPASAPQVARDLTIGEPHRMPGEYSAAQKARRANAPRSELINVPGPAGGDSWFASQRIFPFKTLDIGRSLFAAQTQARSLVSRKGQSAQAAWQNLGPSNIGGRVTDLVVSTTQPGTVYAGAATGGVWKSTDAGATFSRAWSLTDPPSIGALAVTADGVLYAGTGEGNPGGGSVTFPGNGVYRSANGGATWTHAGLAGTDRIGRLAVDPANADRMFAAAAGNLFVPGGSRGLYRTTNGGTSWQLVLPGANATTGAIGVAVDPDNPNRIFAAMWDHRRTANGRHYGGVGSGIYRSIDGGDSWSRLRGGLPAASTNLGRMGIAVAKSDPDRLYVIAANALGTFSGFWTSTNGGDSWTAITNTSYLSASQSTFGWWFGRIFVDPADDRHVFVPGVPMLESLDAGTSWRRNSSSFHVDQHAMVWDQNSAGRVYIGNDGGVYRSQSNGSLTGRWTKSTRLPINQFYTVAVSAQDHSRVLGGAQDNGSIRSWGSSSWNEIYGGDGATNLIDPTNHDKVYSCSQYGSCGRSTNGGSSMSRFGATTSERRGWITPVVFDPNNPAIMYYGGNRLNRSTNSAASWSPISPDLTRGDGGTGGSTFGTITTIAVAKSNSAVIYVGTDDGRMWITRNTGGSWTEITAGLPTRWITGAAVDPTNANVAYVTVSGYANGETAAHVLRTSNGGTTWENISGDLPDAPVNDIALDPGDPAVLYVATDVGVFTTSTRGVGWAGVGVGMPTVPVADLDALASGSSTVLTAATFGLSMYRVTVP